MNKLNHQTARGFSLIELIVTMSIVGVIGAIAWPAYQNTQERSRRAEAKAGVLIAQIFLEKCYGTYRAYDNANCNLPANLLVSADNNYTIAIAASAADTYTLQATPTAGGKQTGDTDCAVFNLTETGAKTALKSDLVTPNDNACWGN